MMQNSDAKTLTPVSSTLFNIDFITEELTTEEKETLKKCVISTSEKKIVFSVLHNDEKIIPIDEILKLKSIKGKFDVEITMLNKENKKIGDLVYKACNMEADLTDLLFFSYTGKNPFGIDLGINKEVFIVLWPEHVLYNKLAL